MNKGVSNFGSMVERFRELRFREWVGLSAKRRGRRKLIGPAPFSLGLPPTDSPSCGKKLVPINE